MPKYHMDFNGTVYRDKMFNSEKPVYVIDAALNEDYCHIDERLNAVDAAIRAALEGAI